MDLAIGAKQTFVMMNLLTRDGAAKIVPRVHLPAHRGRCVSRVYTDLGGLSRSGARAWSCATCSGSSFAELQDLVGVPLIDGTDRLNRRRNPCIGLIRRKFFCFNAALML